MTAIISRSSIVAFGLVVSVSTSTNAEIADAIDKASGDSSFIIAQTEGMERREDRQDNRQDAREEGGSLPARMSAMPNRKDARKDARKRKRKRKRARASNHHRASEGGVSIGGVLVLVDLVFSTFDTPVSRERRRDHHAPEQRPGHFAPAFLRPPGRGGNALTRLTPFIGRATHPSGKNANVCAFGATHRQVNSRMPSILITQGWRASLHSQCHVRVSVAGGSCVSRRVSCSSWSCRWLSSALARSICWRERFV